MTHNAITHQNRIENKYVQRQKHPKQYAGN